MLAPIAPYYRSRRRGVTFTEVMFAVILLGIGFIMLAGLFAVAGQQTIQNLEENAGANFAQAAAEYLRQAADEPGWLSTGGAYRPLPDGAWERLKGDMISAKDPRYAWTAMYSLRPGEQFARVWIISLQSRNKSRFDATDVVRDNRTTANLDPRRVTVQQLINNWNNTGVDRVVFTGYQPKRPELTPISTGAFLVIAEGDKAGHMYRLGSQIDADGYIWQLVPGFELETDAENIGVPTPTPTQALLVGKSFTAPGIWSWGGEAMDIAAYSTTIPLKAK